MKVIREIYLHSKTHLPVHGWFQGCRQCDEITSRINTYKTVTVGKRVYKFIIYLCPRCRKSFVVNKEKNEKFNTKCDKFITKYLKTR